MAPKKIPLREIEKSITINCAVNTKSSRTLQLTKWAGQGLSIHGIGRLLFIYIAQQSGYNREEICDYLTIEENEYLQKAEILDEFYQNGKQLFETVGHSAGYIETKNTYLYFYRKLVLAQNYLRYRFDIK